MNDFIIAPCSNSNLDYLLKSTVNYILIGVEDFCITPNFRMDIDNIIELANNTDKKIIVSINKMMHNSDLAKLEQILNKINKSLIDKVIFYDLSVLNIANRIKFNKDLIISLEHLNASSLTNEFYYKNNVEYSIITSDITKEEINEISKNSNIKLIVNVYGYLLIFYSRRYLISNYLNNFKLEKLDDIYYIKHDIDYYLIKEEKFGTVIFTKKPINLINDYKKLNDVSLFLIDGSYISDEEFINVIEAFINNKTIDNTYKGFFDKKTTYRLKGEENE